MCIYIEIQIDDATIKKKRMIEKENSISLVGKWFEKCVFNEQINVCNLRTN